MNFDKNTGVIEMIMESLTPADEGTFTFQLQDGKATNQSSLVLIGDGTLSQTKQCSWSKVLTGPQREVQRHCKTSPKEM